MSRPEEVDEGLIHAWLDGELTGEEAARVERLAATDAAWSAAVAEARGLIAASTRIVRALDAVPAGVMPAGSKAAPSRGLRVRPWMRMAAGLLLVAGTAYTVREVITTSGVPQPTTDVATAPVESTAPAPTPPPPAAAAAAERRVAAPERTAAVSSDASGAVSGGAGVASNEATVAPIQPQPVVPPPSAPAPMPTLSTQLPETQKALAERAVVERAAAETDRAATTMQRARQERAPSTAAPAPVAAPTRDFAALGAAAGGPMSALEGCWRATAPDSLAALYRDLTILRQRGDTLVLVLPNALTVAVVRRDDELRGGLTASRISCPRESATSPRDSW